MSEMIDQAFDEANDQAEKSLEHLKKELSKLRTGKANPSMLDNIYIDYYGSQNPLNQVANVSAQDSKTLTIQPWDKSIIDTIEKAIFEANLGLTPQNDGEVIRISIPPLTEERRKELVKQAKGFAEETKISLRNVRREVLDVIKDQVKDGYPEDQGKRREAEVQTLMDKYGTKVDEIIEAKEKDIMTI
ncbi:MAG TPA: ribosome recycling factor [Saprospiraceae bacterium]|nr:ribosome recycling factor [Saprospiraceae bacterium]